MSALDRYHVFVHSVSYAIGYDYHDATPDWVHPFIHSFDLGSCTSCVGERWHLYDWAWPANFLEASKYCFVAARLNPRLGH